MFIKKNSLLSKKIVRSPGRAIGSIVGRFMLLKLLLLTNLSIITFIIEAKASEIVLNQDDHYQDLGFKIEFLEDAQSNLTFFEIVNHPGWAPGNSKNLNFGLTPSSYWIKLVVKNQSKFSSWNLELAYPHFDKLILYDNNNGETKQTITGDTFSFKQRPYQHKNFIFPISIPKNQKTTLYLYTQTQGSYQFPLHLWTPQALGEKIAKESFGFGLYYGIMLIMCLYNLFLYITIKSFSQ